MDQEGGAESGLAVERNRPAGLLDDSVDGGQPKSGTGPLVLGGEEGIEYVLPGFVLNADSGIFHREQYVLSRRHAGLPGRVAFRHVHIGGGDGDRKSTRLN